jgi:hypothetical protein
LPILNTISLKREMANRQRSRTEKLDHNLTIRQLLQGIIEDAPEVDGFPTVYHGLRPLDGFDDFDDDIVTFAPSTEVDGEVILENPLTLKEMVERERKLELESRQKSIRENGSVDTRLC